MTRFVKAFEQGCPGRSLNYTPDGSGAGISEFIGNQTDFAGSDSSLSNEEYSHAGQRCGSPAWNLPVVFGPIAIAYHGNDGVAAAVKSTEGAVTYNEWSFAQAQHLNMAEIITSAGPDPVAITPDSVGKTISSAWFIKQGNDLALDTISFYRPNQPDSYPILLATYEIVCSKYPDPQVGAAVRAFLQSTIGGGQDGLADNGYIPIPLGLKSRLSTAVDAIS